MLALRTAIAVIWVAFWIYWFVSAANAKEGLRSGRRLPPGVFIIALSFLLVRVFGANSLRVHDPVLQAVGVLFLLGGLSLAIWARVHLGRNWGMPMTRKAEPELVTSGPYRFIRHPIYTGLLLGILGSGLATNLYWLIAFGVIAAYFIYSARTEEKILTAAFPTQYPEYKAHTKMLIPWIL